MVCIFTSLLHSETNEYMTTSIVISAVLTLVAGIGIFLIACQMMSSNLESASSARLKSLFSKAARSRILGVGIGTVGTAAIQSSGATTVMVIGFVNAGIMSLTQAATIIYGANIGTTVTAQIVALGMFGGAGAISTTIIFSAFAGIGAFLALFAKKDMSKTIGGTLAGFGMLFVGLSMMSGSMTDFAQLAGTDHDNRNIPLFTNSPADLKAVRSRKHDVQNQQIVLTLQRFIQSLIPITAYIHIVSGYLEIIPFKLCDTLFIFNYKYSTHHSAQPPDIF